MRLDVIIRHLYISPGHNYFGHHGRGPGAHPTLSMPEVHCRAGYGLEGDRFFGYRLDYKGQVTFFESEVFEAAKVEFNVPTLSADSFRRNVVIEGARLNELQGTRFTLGGVEFEGMAEARPCYWMDAAVAPGAERWLRGRGGLRAKVLSDGVLRCGAAELVAPGLIAFR